MTEMIGIAISAGAFVLGVITFIVSRYDKKMAKREEVFMKFDKELHSVKEDVDNIKGVSRDHSIKIDNIEKSATKLENNIDKQMTGVNDKLDQIYLLLINKSTK